MTRRLVALALGLVTAAFAVASGDDAPRFDAKEIARIVQHGPWPPPATPDPSNRVSRKPEAVWLGEMLFLDPRVSRDGAMSCATCHVPNQGWAENNPRSVGRVALDRNAPSMWNTGLQRWFGWDGAGDSLWGQSIRPILDAREMHATPAHVASLLRTDPALACRYRAAFGRAATAVGDDELLLVDAGKALAAFQETLVTGRTPFDDFRDALARGDAQAAARYPVAAQRGLRIFIGAGQCSVCHFGPAFTNGEFGDIGVPFFAGPGRVDPGRHGGIAQLRASKFNLLSSFNDDASGASATKTRYVEATHRNFGEFKVPPLRNVARTSPYMHDGRYATLREVVRHYSELNEERLHADGERILKPLRLTPRQTDDLIFFLESLSDRESPYSGRAGVTPPGAPPCP